MENIDCSITKPALEAHRSWFSKLFFIWVDDLLKEGAKKPFTYDDLYNVLKEESINYIIQEDERTLKLYPNDTLLKQINRQMSSLMIACMVFSTLGAILQFSGPLFLNLILKYLVDPDAPVYEGYIYASALLVCTIVRAFFDQHSKHKGSKELAGMMTLNRLFYRIFKKLLIMSTASKKYYDMGKINTMVLVNCQEISFFFMFFPMIFSSPIIIVLATIYIIVQIGWIGVFGPILLGILSYGLYKLENLTIKQRIAMIINSGQRSKLANEFFQGIRIVKYYAWEKFVHKSFGELRVKELQLCKDIASLRGFIEALQTILPTIISITIFGLAVAVGQELNAANVFTVLTLLNMLQLPIRMLISTYSALLSAFVSFERIESFLNAEEKQETDELQDDIYSLKTENAHLAWDSVNAKQQFELKAHLFSAQAVKPAKVRDKQYLELPTSTNLSPQDEQIYMSDLNISIKKGEMLAVVGKVGSGKSALLQAMLGEMNLVSGSIQKRGKIAYVSQMVWLRNATIRDNITFGLPYDEHRFSKTIKICQLEDDLKNLSGGDMTEVGERGINLSGGQKQRLSIARAVYSQSDIYIIDDCLSALDSYVGKRIFHDIIEKELKNTTRIMVTHQLHYLKFFDRVAVIQGGSVVEIDTFRNMELNPNSQLKTLQAEMKEKQEDVDEEPQKLELIARMTSDKQSKQSKHSVMPDALDEKDLILKKQQDKQNQEKGNMIKSEEQSTGSIPWKIYSFYFSSGGASKVIISLFIFFLAQGVRQLCDWWLGMWSEDKFNMQPGEYIGIFAGLMVAASILFWVRFVIFSIVTTTASKHIFQKLVDKIMKAPLAWFDITPLGRIITRCTKNVDDVDFILSMYLQFALYMIITVVSTFIMIAIITPYFLLVCFVLSIYYATRVSYYLKTAREVKRILNIAKAPMIGVISEASLGVHIIRPFKRQEFYFNKFRYYVERHTSAMFHEQWVQRWMSIRTELYGSLIIGAVAYFGVASKNNGTAGSLIGLNLSYAIGIQILLPYMVDILTQTETTMTSVQLIHEYLVTLPQERSYDHPLPPKDWPRQGQLSIKNISFKYRDELDNVIHNISFDINPKEKIGIIGRTGSGKSTLTLGLLRILELSASDQSGTGSIVLDGINIADIGLCHLRSLLSIIPQDPVLFSGDLRRNIDPFQKYQDQDISKIKIYSKVECLRKVSLYDILLLKAQDQAKGAAKPQGGPPQGNPAAAQAITIQLADATVQQNVAKQILGITIEESGSNFSLGEKQLVCLARALIRKPKVLLMDEATASIDERTDSIIQQMIQTEFSHSTVITIAHRLNTIIQYNRILVLKQGTIEEFDTPLNLLQKNSYLTQMVKEHGPEYYQQMKQLAEQSFKVVS